jgi:peptidyl-prolyl cis-trans isomerase D
MLRILRSGQRWLTAVFIAAIGLVFVVFYGWGSGSSQYTTPRDQIVKVGPFEFGTEDFERVRERREAAIQQEIGDKYDQRKMREMVDNLATRELVERALLALAARDLGLRVSTREIERIVLAEPGFRSEDGKFDRERFEKYAQYAYGNHGTLSVAASTKAFLADQRLHLLAVKMLSVLQEQPEVSEGEAREAVRRDLEQVQVAFVTLDAGKGDPPQIPADAIAAAVASRGDEIRKLYEEGGELYNRPERLHARHILRTVASDAPAEEVERVRGEIAGAAQRIANGEPFEQVASELSQDPGSRANGGDLGFFARGQMVKEFEDKAFALTPGQVSEPVKTEFGFHLIEVLERQDALARPLDSVRDEIARELLTREALRDRARKRADEIAEAIRGGQTLEAAAQQREIPVRRSGWLSRKNGFVPGLGTSPEILAAAFVLAPGASSPRVFDAGDGFALLHVVERKEATPQQVDALVEKKREELLSTRREQRIGAWIESHRAALAESGELVVNTERIRG